MKSRDLHQPVFAFEIQVVFGELGAPTHLCGLGRGV
jgi:hypothetical protein